MSGKGTLERDLFESERKFKLLVLNVIDYALFMLDPDGIVSNWNAGAERIKGYRPEEIIGQSFSRFYTPADQANGKPARALQIARETGRYEEEGWRVRKDGSFFWASVIIDQVRDEDGTLIGFAKITRDITERREAQKKYEALQKQLAESQKMDAIGQLTGGIAHDFNNLLMIISGNLNAIKRSLTDEKAIRALASVESASQRGAVLTRQLLTFARRQNLRLESIDVIALLNSVYHLLNSGIGGSVSLMLNIEKDVWPVKADAGELETALFNLGINARDAMPDGGSVTIGVKNVTMDDFDFVAIGVTDTGMGIPDDVVNKVFDPFFTTKPIGKGTGLGLSQVYGFVQQAGGTVKLETGLGKGTTVTLYLPRSNGIVDQDKFATVASIGTVLLVEDNPDVAQASRDLLEQLGYKVKWAQDADAALRQIERDGIDLVFSDIVMPGKMDGMGLAKAIRAMNPKMPILLTSGYSNSAFRNSSGFPILHKPFQLHELSRELAKLSRAAVVPQATPQLTCERGISSS